MPSTPQSNAINFQDISKRINQLVEEADEVLAAAHRDSSGTGWVDSGKKAEVRAKAR